MTDPRVTIGMVVKNDESTIDEAVRSVIRQDYDHNLLEILVVDGKSTDSTLFRLEKLLSESDIAFGISSDGGKGLGVARDMVVRRAQGEYIVWVDGDFTLPPNFVRTHVALMQRNPRLGIIAAPYSYGGDSLVATLEAVENLMDTCTCRVKAIRNAGGFDPQIVGAGEDVDLLVRVAALGWSIAVGPTKLRHNFKETWKGLCAQYRWFGYGIHYVTHKHRTPLGFWLRTPPIAFLRSLILASKEYKAESRRFLFLLPFHSAIKRTAWFLGYLEAHINGYGHSAAGKKHIAETHRQIDHIVGKRVRFRASTTAG